MHVNNCAITSVEDGDSAISRFIANRKLKYPKSCDLLDRLQIFDGTIIDYCPRDDEYDDGSVY